MNKKIIFRIAATLGLAIIVAVFFAIGSLVLGFFIWLAANNHIEPWRAVKLSAVICVLCYLLYRSWLMASDFTS